LVFSRWSRIAQVGAENSRNIPEFSRMGSGEDRDSTFKSHHKLKRKKKGRGEKSSELGKLLRTLLLSLFCRRRGALFL
jgi:hypothetical protein